MVENALGFKYIPQLFSFISYRMLGKVDEKKQRFVWFAMRSCGIFFSNVILMPRALGVKSINCSVKYFLFMFRSFSVALNQ